MKSILTDLLYQQAQTLKQQGLYRRRILSDKSSDKLDDDSNINFCSNDYLSLRNDTRIKDAFVEGFRDYPAGSGASMSISGYHTIHHHLEQTVAALLGVDAILLFNCGYMANLSVIAMLAELQCHLIVDKSIHASIYDGIKLSNVQYTRFLHNNINDLTQKMTHNDSATEHSHIVITEGIFSMSGQQADLTSITQLCHLYPTQATCIVDESHSFGILGPNGLGAIAHHQLTQKQVPLRIISFGKAMGSQGALVAGLADWVDGIFQNARPHRYSTAISPAIAYGLLKSFAIVLGANEQRKRLFQLIAYFKNASKKSPLCFRSSDTPIQQLQLGCPHLALKYASELKRHGILCQAVRQPTVSRHDTGLRVVLNANHQTKDIDYLFEQLHRIYEIYGRDP